MIKTGKKLIIILGVAALNLAVTGILGCGSGKEEEPTVTQVENTEEPAEEPAEETAEKTEEEQPEETEPEETQETEPVSMYAGSRVNVRSEASTESDIVAVLNRREEIQKIGEEGEWTKIILDGETCYVASAYLVTEDALPSMQDIRPTAIPGRSLSDREPARRRRRWPPELREQPAAWQSIS